MTEPDPMSPEERELEEFLARRGELSRRYREAEGEGAPPELDVRVLLQARAELERAPQRARRWRQWGRPVSLAASLVLVVSLGWVAQRQPLPQRSAAMAGPAPLAPAEMAAPVPQIPPSQDVIAEAQRQRKELAVPDQARPQRKAVQKSQKPLRSEAQEQGAESTVAQPGPSPQQPAPAPSPAAAAVSVGQSRLAAPPALPTREQSPWPAAPMATVPPPPSAPVAAAPATSAPVESSSEPDTDAPVAAAPAPASAAPPPPPPAPGPMPRISPPVAAYAPAPIMSAPAARADKAAAASGSCPTSPVAAAGSLQDSSRAAWLERIRRLRDVPDLVAAKKELACYRAVYSSEPVPDDLKPLLEVTP